MRRSQYRKMKKSTIWFLTIIMALTFMGLLYVQIMYMKNMVRMRDDQFSEGVKRSLYAVSTMLEQDETKHYLEEDIAQIEASSIYSQYGDGASPNLEGVKLSFTTPSGVETDITIKGDPMQLNALGQGGSSIIDRAKSMPGGAAWPVSVPERVDRRGDPQHHKSVEHPAHHGAGRFGCGEGVSAIRA